jgi:predicted O-methyltransferase YrrM
MINRIVNKLKFLYLKRSIGSYESFKKTHNLQTLDSLIPVNREKLRPFYEQYIKEISSPDMAASLELAAFIYSFCQIKGCKKLLDIGSGFSSFICRRFASETPAVETFTVDDDEAWLKKTNQYLEKHHLNTDNLFTMDQFLSNDLSGFDFILHDLNFVEVRINHLETIMKLIKRDGFVILDDVHKPDYLFAALVKLRKNTVNIFSLQSITTDRFGRFSLMVVKKH